MSVTFKLRNLDKLADALSQGIDTKPVLRMGVAVSGKAAAYALVWEYGRVDCKPGPKTLYSTNFEGQQVVLTRSAPLGFIRVNNARYREYVRAEMKGVDWKKLKITQIPSNALKALARAAYKCADLISITAPKDTGELSLAIRSADLSEVGVDTTQETVSLRTKINRGAK